MLAKDPTSIRASIGLGRIQLAKDPAAAEALFQQVLQRQPRELTALNNLGIARDLLGRHAEAQTAYRQALAINPDLESAQVNLALSMAMSGQGPAAIQLLKPKATEPDAAVKVKHDYAVVLAMAGHRAEAEQVLGDDLAPDDVRQVLDSVTGTHTRIARDVRPAADGETLAARDDDVPPDVVQVPEAAPRPLAPSRMARIPAPPAPAATPTAMAAALAAPPPMIVRPTPIAEPESAAPITQPTNPVAAAVANDQSLSLPIRANVASSGQVAAPDPALVTPSVVAMPPAPPVQHLAPTRAAADTGRIALPDAPTPVLRTEPLAERPHAAATRIALPIRQMATAEAATQSEAPPAIAARTEAAAAVKSPVRAAVSVPSALAMVASVASAPTRGSAEVPSRVASHPATAAGDDETAAAPPARDVARDEASPMVQFAAAPSEEAAHSFWRVLVHRFPEALGQREAVVLRFERGGTVFWRVRTEGFDTLSEAQSLCNRMRAGGQDCFVPRS